MYMCGYTNYAMNKYVASDSGTDVENEYLQPIGMRDKIEYMKATDKTVIDKIGVEGRLMEDLFVLKFRNLTVSIEPEFLAITKTY